MKIYSSMAVAPIAVLGVAVAAVVLMGQSFEVASVKPLDHPVGPHAVSLETNHGRVTFTAAALRQMIGLAYSIQRVRVVGGPDWLDSELYDVVARSENPDASRADILLMVQKLLGERFKLAVHRETKELTQYVLAVGKHGPKLKDATDDEKTALVPEFTAGARQISFYKMPLAGLVNTLANQLGSPVLDQTGLTGLYDFKLDWTSAGPGPQATEAGNATASADLSASLFSALSDQLGLTLQAKKVATEVLIVDHAERASEN